MNIPKPLKTEPAVQGFKYLELLGTLLTDLHEAGAQRDRAGNRELFYDQYALLFLLFLLYYYNPTISSLRGLQRLTDLNKVRHLGIHRTSLGSMSEAQHVFDAALLEKVTAELAGRLPTQRPKPGQAGQPCYRWSR